MTNQQKSMVLVAMKMIIIASFFYRCGENASGATTAEIQEWLKAHNIQWPPALPEVTEYVKTVR